MPPTHATQQAPTEVNSQMEWTRRAGSSLGGPLRAIENPAYIESDGTAQDKRPELPLPDYETLFPKKRHGVQGQTRWDNLVAEVQQKKRNKPDIFLGQEMSVDGPEERKPNRGPSPSSLMKQSESPRSQVYEAKPISSKRMPAPSKPVAAPLPRATVDSNQTQSPSVTQAYSQTGRDIKTEQVIKVVPTAKPRQNLVHREGGRQADVTPTDSIKSNSPLSNKMDKKLKEDEFGTSHSREPVSRDSWAKLEQNQAADNLFTGKVQQGLKLEDRGMTGDDFDQLFTGENPTDPFGSSYSRDSEKSLQQFDQKDFDSNQQIPHQQSLHSQKSEPSNSKRVKGKQEPAATPTTVVESPPSQETATNALFASHGMEWTENAFGADPFGRDPFGSDPFAGDPSKPAEPHPSHPSVDEPGAQTEGPSGGKNLLRAWVSPTEGQPVSAQNSSVGGPASYLRR